MKAQSKNVSVLVVDDSHISLAIQAHLFKELGFDVTVSEDPRQVFEILSRKKIDYVLTDIEMPGMRGDEMAVLLHHIFPTMPVVAITSADLSRLQLRNNANFYNILQKPLTIEKINSTFPLIEKLLIDSDIAENKETCKTNVKIINTFSGKRVLLGSQFPGVYLTMREAELALLLAEYKYHEIAKLLNISKRTVEFYSTNIRKKLHCRNKKSLASLLRDSGVLDKLKELIDISHLILEDNKDKV